MNNSGMRRKEVYNRTVDLYAVSLLGRVSMNVCGAHWGAVVCRMGDDAFMLGQGGTWDCVTGVDAL